MFPAGDVIDKTSTEISYSYSVESSKFQVSFISFASYINIFFLV